MMVKVYMCEQKGAINVIFLLPGTSWAEVESPGKEIEALHVAVGVSVVWVITKDYKVNQNCSRVCNSMIAASRCGCNIILSVRLCV